MTEQVVYQGMTRLRRQLHTCPLKLKAAVPAVGMKAAEIVAKAAERHAPKRSGRLAASIRPAMMKYGAVVMAGGGTVPYAAPVHWGWPAHNITEQPFVYQGLDENVEEIKRLYDKGVNAVVESSFGTFGAV
jgi:hypothetical protein